MSEKSSQYRGDLIRKVTRTLRNLGLGIDDIGKSLGYQGNVGGNPGYIERELIERKLGKDVEERATAMLAIYDRLEELFEHDLAKIQRWSKVRNGDLSNMTLLEFLPSASLKDLSKILNILESIDLSKF